VSLVAVLFALVEMGQHLFSDSERAAIATFPFARDQRQDPTGAVFSSSMIVRSLPETSRPVTDIPRS